MDDLRLKKERADAYVESLGGTINDEVRKLEQMQYKSPDPDAPSFLQTWDDTRRQREEWIADGTADESQRLHALNTAHPEMNAFPRPKDEPPNVPEEFDDTVQPYIPHDEDSMSGLETIPNTDGLPFNPDNLLQPPVLQSSDVTDRAPTRFTRNAVANWRTPTLETQNLRNMGEARDRITEAQEDVRFWKNRALNEPVSLQVKDEPSLFDIYTPPPEPKYPEHLVEQRLKDLQHSRKAHKLAAKRAQIAEASVKELTANAQQASFPARRMSRQASPEPFFQSQPRADSEILARVIAMQEEVDKLSASTVEIAQNQMLNRPPPPEERYRHIQPELRSTVQEAAQELVNSNMPDLLISDDEPFAAVDNIPNIEIQDLMETVLNQALNAAEQQVEDIHGMLDEFVLEAIAETAEDLVVTDRARNLLTQAAGEMIQGIDDEKSQVANEPAINTDEIEEMNEWVEQVGLRVDPERAANFPAIEGTVALVGLRTVRRTAGWGYYSGYMVGMVFGFIIINWPTYQTTEDTTLDSIYDQSVAFANNVWQSVVDGTNGVVRALTSMKTGDADTIYALFWSLTQFVFWTVAIGGSFEIIANTFWCFA